jgi:hypothetical protein
MLEVIGIKDVENVSSINVLDEFADNVQVEYVVNGITYIKWFQSSELFVYENLSLELAHSVRQTAIDQILARNTNNPYIANIQSTAPDEYIEKLKKWEQFTVENDYVIYKNGSRYKSKDYVATQINQQSVKANADYTFDTSNYFQVSQYDACSPLCITYQGKIGYKNKRQFYRDRDKAKENGDSDTLKIFDAMFDYEEATSGEGEGWFQHPNCKHAIFQFDPFFNKPPKQKYSDEEVSQNYIEKQKQNAIKRKETDKKTQKEDIY